MRKLLFTLIFAALLLFAACADQPIAPPQTAIEQSPVRVAPVPDSQFCAAIAPIGRTGRAATVNGRLWPNGAILKVKLIGGNAQQRRYFTDAFIEWEKVVNLTVSYVTTGNADIRCSFVSGQGSWSYIGTDAKGIPQSQANINIGWLGSDVCLHEIGHALGMAHEQASPNSTICWNKEAVYSALGGPPNNWSKETVDWNVFRKMTAQEASASVFDPLSIMQYSVPASWLCQPSSGIAGGKALSPIDKAFMASKYPRPTPPPPTVATVSIPTWQRDSILKWMQGAIK